MDERLMSGVLGGDVVGVNCIHESMHGKYPMSIPTHSGRNLYEPLRSGTLFFPRRKAFLLK